MKTDCKALNAVRYWYFIRHAANTHVRSFVLLSWMQWHRMPEKIPHHPPMLREGIFTFTVWKEIFCYLIISHTGDWQSQLFPDRYNCSVQSVLCHWEFEGMKSIRNVTVMVTPVMSLYWLSLSVKCSVCAVDASIKPDCSCPPTQSRVGRIITGIPWP